MGKLVDLTDERIGRLVVLNRSGNIKGKVAWLCQCDCGNTKEITASQLRAKVGKRTESCGCLQDEHRRRRTLYPSMDKEDKRVYQQLGYKWTQLYKIDEEYYRGLLDNQRGCCASCGNSLTDAHVDHNHKTGEVRGLLCPGCNTAAGLLRDSSEVSMKLATYLMKYGC